MTWADGLALVALALLALAAGFAGVVDLPFSQQEALVAQLARNALGSGHWVVPYFNGSPRPDLAPLAGWASALSARLLAHGRVDAWVVRLPGVVAGLALVWIVFAVARGERGTATGLFAGLLAVASLGFFLGIHGGQPDMIRALLAFAVFFAYWLARRSRGVGQLLAALAIWLALGLEILAGGLLFAGCLLAGCLFHDLAAGPQWRATWRRFRPLLGLVLLALLLWPWIPLIKQQAASVQLAQWPRLGLLPGLDPVRFFDTVAWLRAAVQWLPWLVPVVPALLVSWRQRGRTAGLLLILLALPIVLFSLAPSYRHLAILPTLGLAAVWLALGSSALWASPGPAARLGFWLQNAIGLALICWIAYQASQHRVPWVDFTITCAVAAAVLALAALLYSRRGRAMEVARWLVWSLLGVALIVVLLQAAPVLRSWQPTRFYMARLTQYMAPFQDRPVAVLAPQPPYLFVYYLNRPVYLADNLDDLCRWAAAQRKAKPLALFNPRAARRVKKRMAAVHPLLQSPGSPASSVIAAVVTAPEQCGPVAGSGGADGKAP
jgi:4-amino-4-deoxy-L-arabinose transferase-like glycosyltransferase